MTGNQLAAAITLLQQGKGQEAWQLCEIALSSGARDFDTLNTAGTIALHVGDVARGVDLLEQAVACNPAVARTHCNLGLGQQRLARHAEAVASFDRALALKPSLVDAQINRAAALTSLDRLEEALVAGDTAIAANPDAVEAHLNRAIVLRRLERAEEAVSAYERAIALQPNNYRAHEGRGSVLESLRRMGEALTSFDRVVALKPDLATAHFSRGLALAELGRFEESVAAYDRALALSPHDPGAYTNRGESLRRLNRHPEALASYDRAIALNPLQAFIGGLRLNMKLQMCDWQDLDAEIARLTDQVMAGYRVTPALPFLAACDSPAAQLKAAETWDKTWHTLKHPASSLNTLPRHDKIRVAYITGDFYAHAVSFLIAESFELHDRSRFEFTAFCFSPTTGDYMQDRVRRAFGDRFIDVRDRSNAEVAMLAREMEIDIAVDLKGFTHDERATIFAHRAAPVQVNYLGYPGTMGAAYMDYIIADPILVPERDRRWYAEKVVTLPDTYQPNDTQRAVAAQTFTRAELNLPENGFVFVCFNNTFKILPHVFDVWMRILKQVDGSVLWLLADNPHVLRNLRQEAQKRGVDPQRLVFADRTLMPLHLARQAHGDLFLDTAPYNAHTTASDALWMGLPIVTCPGQTFASRVAASLLTAAGLPEMVASSWEDYERLAVTLALSPDKMSALKEKVRRVRTDSALFDARRFTRHLEAAYTAMYERMQSGLAPDHIEVDLLPS